MNHEISLEPAGNRLLAGMLEVSAQLSVTENDIYPRSLI
jgi:hypothetical protein